MDDVRAALHSIDPNLPLYDMATMDGQVEKYLVQQRLLAILSTFFGVLALGLSAVGLYGVISYGVARRTGEIGIRIALGAQRSGILRIVLSEAALMVGVGIAIGLPLALSAGRLIESLLFGVRPGDALSLAASVAVLAVAASLLVVLLSAAVLTGLTVLRRLALGRGLLGEPLGLLGPLGRRGGGCGSRRGAGLAGLDGGDEVTLAHLGGPRDPHAGGQALQLGEPHGAQRTGSAGLLGCVLRSGVESGGVCHEGSFPLVCDPGSEPGRSLDHCQSLSVAGGATQAQETRAARGCRCVVGAQVLDAEGTGIGCECSFNVTPQGVKP
jgi:hypothetical protein